MRLAGTTGGAGYLPSGAPTSRPLPLTEDRTMPVTSTDERLQQLFDDTAIIDSLHRYTAGLDQADADLVASSLTEDAVVDPTRATEKIGFALPALFPRDVAVSSLIGALRSLDTSHSVSNVRIYISGDTATVHCHAHVRLSVPGEDGRPEQRQRVLMMNRYEGSAVRDGHQWRFRRLTIDNVWFELSPATGPHTAG
jgi:ketosteroid isomerase-like protein